MKLQTKSRATNYNATLWWRIESWAGSVKLGVQDTVVAAMISATVAALVATENRLNTLWLHKQLCWHYYRCQLKTNLYPSRLISWKQSPAQSLCNPLCNKLHRNEYDTQVSAENQLKSVAATCCRPYSQSNSRSYNARKHHTWKIHKNIRWRQTTQETISCKALKQDNEK